MARAGLSRLDVKRARDSLAAQGQHPSIDAIRIALGNTGSKTTIHRYLKELEEEEDTAFARVGARVWVADVQLAAAEETVRLIREAGGAAERDQRQPVQHARIEQAAQPAPAVRGDQPLLLVEAQRRGAHARQFRNLRDVDVPHVS
mgnify:CR=1 FL=1